MRGFLATAIFALLTVLAVTGQTILVARTGLLLGDFHAFYCAARVAAEGEDPYRTEPLRSCEGSTGLGAFQAKHPGVAIPAPLPGYAIAIFEPLAALPPPFAGMLWFGMLVAAGAASVLALTRFAAIPWPIPVGAFLFSLGVASIPAGELVPIAIAAISVSAYFAWRGRWRAAAIAGAIAMLEPHLGLPVCVALFVWAPATRVTLVVSAALLASLSLLTIGPAGNAAYFASVLPAHALSEASRDTQFSLTSVLASLGVSDAAAVRAGSIWYVAMLILGTVTAGRLAKNTGNSAFLACVPPAFAVFGGTFVHVTQIAVALPATLLLLPYVGSQHRALVATAAMLLAVPWILAWSPILGLAPIFPIAYFAWSTWYENLRAALIAGLVAGILLIGLNCVARATPAPTRLVAASSIDPSLAEASWREFTSENSGGGVSAWLVRIPTWSGLGILLGLALVSAKLPSARPARGGTIT